MKMFLALLDGALRLLRRIVIVTIIALFAYMIVAVTAQVIARYTFSFNIAWATETATIAQIWLVLIGAGYAMHKGLHVGVGIVAAMLPSIAQRVLNAIVTALALWFLWIVFSGSFRLLTIGAIQTSPALQIPMYYPYLVIPIGTAYLALELVLAQVPRILGWPPAEGAPAESTGGAI
jgi:TRAP-type C4-dicarboxylate transport system permease small subunit